MAAVLKDRYKRIVSLGSNCFIKKYIDQKIFSDVKQETQLFDWIGTSFWAINALLENNFRGILDPREFAYFRVRADEGSIVTNNRYYLRFKHDLEYPRGAQYPEFRSKIIRRVERFERILREGHLLFIRLQEDTEGRLYPPHAPVVDEYESLCKFATLIGNKYKTPAVTILYITTDREGWDETNTIYSIRIPTLKVSWEECVPFLDSHLTPHLPVLLA